MCISATLALDYSTRWDTLYDRESTEQIFMYSRQRLFFSSFFYDDKYYYILALPDLARGPAGVAAALVDILK